MDILKDMLKKPYESIASVTLLVVSVSFGFLLNSPYTPFITTIIAAIGSLLFSHSMATKDPVEKATEILTTKLGVTARYLSDSVSRIRNAIKLYYGNEKSAEFTIDTINQLSSSIITSLNEINIISGNAMNVQGLIETVSALEDIVRGIDIRKDYGSEEDYDTDQDNREVNKVSIDQSKELIGQIESLKLQLDSVVKIPTDNAVIKKREVLSCPKCGTETQVILGIRSGDSAFATCHSCFEGFHIHRGPDGKPFTRMVGEATFKQLIKIKCPECGIPITINYDMKKSSIDRICLSCLHMMTIKKNGDVTKGELQSIVPGKMNGFAGNRQIIGCPLCGEEHVVIWSNPRIARSVCPQYLSVVEIPREYKEIVDIDANIVE